MTIRRGILKSFDAGTYTATVEMAGSIGGWLSALHVARNIASGDLVAGRSVAVAFFDAGNPNDCVLFAVWA